MGRSLPCYQLQSDGSYRSWFRNSALGRTLTSLQSGDTYWFLLDEPLLIRDGFSIASPLGDILVEGWNDFVYYGASDNVHDAFRAIMQAGPRSTPGRRDQAAAVGRPGVRRLRPASRATSPTPGHAVRTWSTSTNPPS